MRSFTGCDPCTHNSENTWFTPKEILDNLPLFDMDVCTVSNRPFDVAKKHIELDKGQNSFEIPWEGFVWMNPPYGKEIPPFIDKFIKHHNGIALVFSRMGTKWIQDFLLKGDAIFFLRKRIKFINKYGEQKTNAGTDSCLLLCGQKAIESIEKSSLDGVLVRLKKEVKNV